MIGRTDSSPRAKAHAYRSVLRRKEAVVGYLFILPALVGALLMAWMLSPSVMSSAN